MKSRMTDADVIRHIRDDTPLNQIRSKLSGWLGRIEQEGAQRHSPSPIEMRRLEFEALEELREMLKPSPLPLSEMRERLETVRLCRVRGCRDCQNHLDWCIARLKEGEK